MIELPASAGGGWVLPADADGAAVVVGCGGVGKTFLENTLLQAVRGDSSVALAAAPTGMAATLLSGGRTCHSLWRLGLDPEQAASSRIELDSGAAALMRAVKLIIIDEAFNFDRRYIEAIDSTLQDIMNCNRLFGGKVVVLWGDPRQILPVVARGNRAAQVNASLRSSALWQQLQRSDLTINMRVQTATAAGDAAAAAAAAEWAQLLLDIGNGVLPRCPGYLHDPDDVDNDCIAVPQHLLAPEGHGESELIDWAFPELAQRFRAVDYRLAERVIVSPRNTQQRTINALCLQRLPGSLRTVYSADSVGTDDDSSLYTSEALNALTPSGFPTHRLDFKVRAPLILLRTIDPGRGLANGARLILLSASTHLLRVRVASGSHIGTETFIPRCKMSSNAADLPFTLLRVGFPVALAFSLTVNKAQGCTLLRCGIFLPTPVFSHGQFYVAASRVGSAEGVRIVVKHPNCASVAPAPAQQQQQQQQLQPVCTANVVYREVLRGDATLQHQPGDGGSRLSMRGRGASRGGSTVRGRSNSGRAPARGGRSGRRGGGRGGRATDTGGAPDSSSSSSSNGGAARGRGRRGRPPGRRRGRSAARGSSNSTRTTRSSRGTRTYTAAAEQQLPVRTVEQWQLSWGVVHTDSEVLSPLITDALQLQPYCAPFIRPAGWDAVVAHLRGCFAAEGIEAADVAMQPDTHYVDAAEQERLIAFADGQVRTTVELYITETRAWAQHNAHRPVAITIEGLHR
jgi:ATP-dependent DNA helicase PIF1